MNKYEITISVTVQDTSYGEAISMVEARLAATPNLMSKPGVSKVLTMYGKQVPR